MMVQKWFNDGLMVAELMVCKGCPLCSAPLVRTTWRTNTVLRQSGMERSAAAGGRIRCTRRKPPGTVNLVWVATRFMVDTTKGRWFFFKIGDPNN